MKTFKTKYQLINNNIDVLNYINNSNDTSSVSSNLKMKEANYAVNHVKAISSAKHINLSVDRISGKGYNERVIYEHDCINGYSDVNTGFAILNKAYKRRLIKKDNIIYDLLN
jgi:hypothetical protein